MLVEIVFVRNGCFIFNNSAYFTTSDVTSFVEGMYFYYLSHVFIGWLFVLRVRFHNKYILETSVSAGARELEAPPGSGSGAPPQKIFEFFYIKMACSGAL